jgi:hypothetical protein
MPLRAVWPILCGSVLWGAACGGERFYRDVRIEPPRAPEEPARVKTAIGTFEVNEKNAELLRRMIAGESVPVQFYAGGDLQ